MLARLAAGAAAAAIVFLTAVPAAQAQSARPVHPPLPSRPTAPPSPAPSSRPSPAPPASPRPRPPARTSAGTRRPGRIAAAGRRVQTLDLHRGFLAALPRAKAGPIGGVVYARGRHAATGRAARAGWRAHVIRAASTAASSTTPLVYRGGAVQHSPHVYLLLWGPDWSGTEASDASYLEHFYSGLGYQPNDTWSDITSQYGDSAGNPAFPGSVYMGAWNDSSTPPYGATQSQIAAEADAFAANRGITDLAGAQIIVATQSGTCPQGFYAPSCAGGTGTYCAWHSYSQQPYTNLPYLPDAGSACGENAVQGADDGFSIVGGHEYGETITDPSPGAGWTDSTGAEIGDKCAWTGLGKVSLDTGTFAMQPLFSNLSLATGGQGCVLSAGEVAAPAAVTGPDGAVRVFARQAGLGIGEWDFGTSLTTGTLGGYWPAPQAALADASGVLRVYGIGTTGDLYEAHQPSGGSWSTWTDLGNPGSQLTGVPAAVQDKSGTVRVYARARNGALYEIHLPAGGTWSSWYDLGGSWPDNPAALVDSSGVVRVYATGTTANLYEDHLSPGAAWSGWWDMRGTLHGAATAVQDHTGTIRVYDRGTNGALEEIHLPAGGTWSSWYDLGGSWPDSLTALVDSSGVVRVYGAGTTGDLYEQHLNPGGAWSGWYDIGFGFEGVPAAIDANGTVQVFARGTGQQLAEASLSSGQPWATTTWGGALY